MTPLPEGLEYKKIYFTGLGKRGDDAAVKDPPTYGWQGSVVIPNVKSTVLFCPFSYEANTVPSRCGELRTAKPQEM